MPVVRWLHKTWNFFWSFIAITSLILVVLGGILFGLAQLDTTKSYIASRIENNFNTTYRGVLSIGKLDGLMPMRFELSEVKLYPDSSTVEPVFSADSISANLEIFALLRNEFIVNALSIDQPRLIIDSESEVSFPDALKKRNDSPVSDTAGQSGPFFEILAPSVNVRQGEVVLRNAVNPSARFPSDSLSFQDIDLAMFFEYKKEQRFLDIDNLVFRLPEAGINFAQIYGQVYNDVRFLEFNSFNVNTEGSTLRFSGEADGVDLFKGDILTQLKKASLQFSMDELMMTSSRLQKLAPDFPDLTNPLLLSIQGEGYLDSLLVEDLDFQYGNTGFSAYGVIKDILNADQLGFRGALREVLFQQQDVQELLPGINTDQLAAFQNTTFRADIEGTLSNIEGMIQGNSERGSFRASGRLGIDGQKNMNLTFSTDSLDVGGLFGKEIKSSSITSSGILRTQDYTDLSAVERFEWKVRQGEFNGAQFDSLNLVASAQDGIIRPEFNLYRDRSVLSGEGSLDLSSGRNRIQLAGSASDLDLKNLSQIPAMAPAVADIEYEIQLQGNSLDDFTGFISVDVPFSVVGGDTLQPHLLYADVSEETEGNRTLRITTSVADFSLNGSFILTEIPALARQWGTFFKNKVRSEILFKEPVALTQEAGEGLKEQDFSLSLQLKDLSYLYAYFPDLPAVKTGAGLSGSVTANEERLLFNAEVNEPHFEYRDTKVDTMRAQITSSFRYNQPIKEFSVLRLQTTFNSIESGFLQGRGLVFNSTLRSDSLNVEANFERIGENAVFTMKSRGSINDSTLNLTIDGFVLGSDIYSWTNEDTAKITYTDEDKLILEDFRFMSDEQLLSIDGAFSSEEADSVNYILRGVNLARVSELVNGRIDFDGTLNGTFTTRALTRLPTIVGEVDLDGFSIDDNVVGDLNISSVFNQELNRFDTRIEVLTDSTKYPDYFIRNDRDGQNINIDGYVLAPVNGEFPQSDSLFYFDLNFTSIDLWVIPFLAPRVFTEMSGIASGDGAIWGNFEDFDFSVDYTIGMEDAVYMKPRFLDTYYYGQGPVTFTKSEGLVFEDIYLIDPSGGMATLSGNYNFNSFQPVHNMDITIETDEFQFLNNDFDPTVPFFGEAYGTGVVRLTGTNLSPVISTTEPMLISDFSEIGLPLLEETEFDEDNNFIQFVESFDIALKDSAGNGAGLFNEGREIDPSELSFAERFTLDLQFVANDPMTVRLIFDPVTGDIITANGTGRIRIQLQDQDLSMFGRFNITDGEYQFVSGDIFTRRFTLEPGGSIAWDGDPENARIDINAVYSARPNIQTLSTERANIDPNDAQRVRVELVLNIGGSLSSIENNFFFRLPNTIETRQNSALSAQIAALNRNEDEKLLQATSFLLMGDFIPSNSTTSAATSLSSNFSSSAAVLNPLLSSQVISPLLSNQINSLLRSDISSLDVDFNLNTYNQIDLGVALRLYNDKLILRRDGQITGAQSNIGDIGATYRINRTLSVTAFHRQDPIFNDQEVSQSTQQSQDINGIGVEAEFSFNKWNEFLNKLASPFRRLFGKKEQDSSDEIARNDNTDEN